MNAFKGKYQTKLEFSELCRNQTQNPSMGSEKSLTIKMVSQVNPFIKTIDGKFEFLT